MARRCSLLLLIVALAAVANAAERENATAYTGGMIWSTAKEEEANNLLRKEDPEILDDRDYIDGGFSSLDGMLQWAIGHSDPVKLKETVQEVRRMSDSELKKGQVELKELMETLKLPSDAQLMQIVIGDLNNASLHVEDRLRALQELLILVEPADNANVAVIIKELDHPEFDVRKLSAWVIGKVLELGALAKLMMMVKSEFVEEAIKALYAVSALIRNNLSGQELFYAEAGDLIIQDILSNATVDVRLRRKAVFLVGDPAEFQLEAAGEGEIPFFRNRHLFKFVVGLMASSDLDLQEKALFAVKNLLLLRATETQVFKDFCGLDVAPERMRQQLDHLMEEESQREYAMDVESLRRDVELTFQKKLGMETQQVPT